MTNHVVYVRRKQINIIKSKFTPIHLLYSWNIILLVGLDELLIQSVLITKCKKQNAKPYFCVRIKFIQVLKILKNVLNRFKMQKAKAIFYFLQTLAIFQAFSAHAYHYSTNKRNENHCLIAQSIVVLYNKCTSCS